MLKKFCCIGLGAAILLSPIAVLAQTYQTAAPAAAAGGQTDDFHGAYGVT